MFDWLYDVINYVLVGIFGLWVSIGSYIWTQLETMWQWFLEVASSFVGALWNALLMLVPLPVWTFFSTMQDQLAAYGPYLEDVSWIFPVVPALGLISTVYALTATVRLLRWIKSCIPTVSGA